MRDEPGPSARHAVPNSRPPALAARAVWFTAPRTAEFREETAPSPGPGEVRIRALASAISHGTEMLVYRGEVPADLPLDLPTLAGGFSFPIKYGYAVVGHVLDAGPGADPWQPGDLAFVLHPHQTVFTVPAAPAVRLPPGVDPQVAVFTANLETAVNVLLDTPLRLGETAAVFGQGTVGLLIARLLRRAGAGRIIAVEPAPRRQEAARAAGVDDILAPGPGLPEQIRARTGGRGVDVAIEVSGSPAALQAAIDCVTDEGTVVVVSWYGAKPVTLNLGGRFHRGRVRLRSSQVGRIDPALAPRWDHARRMALVLDLLPGLRLAELISHRFPFTEAQAAYHLIDEHGDETVQVVLTYDAT
jgi:2-desacetyl-2-hydroxyethyl bacteriochlorophyllide A dehydrogenase